MSKQNDNLYWIDALRVFATLSVILLHTATPILRNYGSISGFDWWIGNIYDGFVRFCVPIFLMISGALLFSKPEESIGQFLKKRFLRILLPFLFWIIIYVLRDVLIQILSGENMTVIESINFRLRGGGYHFWYIYMIIGLYLFFPIIGKWINASKKSEIKYFLFIWLLTIFIPVMLTKKLNLTYFSGYIGFPVLGYYLYRNSFAWIDNQKIVPSVLIFVGILITIFGTFAVTKYHGIFYDGFYMYLAPNVILVAIGVFLLFKNLESFNTKTAYLISFFSKYSYGIYLIHVLVLETLSILGLQYTFINPIIGIPVTSILCFVISSLIVWGVNNLPYGKYISG